MLVRMERYSRASVMFADAMWEQRWNECGEHAPTGVCVDGWGVRMV
jgi:hypothetical protein